MYHQLPVYKDTYALVLLIYECTSHFSKEYKYTLKLDMKRDALALARCIYRANKATQKREHLEKFLDGFELLKMEIRLSTDMKLLPIKKNAAISLLMDGIGLLAQVCPKIGNWQVFSEAGRLCGLVKPVSNWNSLR